MMRIPAHLISSLNKNIFHFFRTRLSINILFQINKHHLNAISLYYFRKGVQFEIMVDSKEEGNKKNFAAKKTMSVVANNSHYYCYTSN